MRGGADHLVNTPVFTVYSICVMISDHISQIQVKVQTNLLIKRSALRERIVRESSSNAFPVDSLLRAGSGC